MSIPREISSVKRPSNTVVRALDGRYYVIARTTLRYKGHNYYIELGRIGEIVDGKYLPLANPVLKDPEQAKNHKIELLEAEQKENQKSGKEQESISDEDGQVVRRYGLPTYLDNVCRDLLTDLEGAFFESDAQRVYCLALLRAASPESDGDILLLDYEDSFLELMYPGFNLSEEVQFWQMTLLGADYARIRAFWEKRVKSMAAGGLLAIDIIPLGYGSSDETSVLFFEVTGGVYGSDYTAVVAYRIDTKELVASKAYAGYGLESSVVTDFVKEFGIRGAILPCAFPAGYDIYGTYSPADEDEPGDMVASLRIPMFREDCFSESDLKTLAGAGVGLVIPLERNDARIEEYGMWETTSTLGGDSHRGVPCRKVRMKDGYYLYSYRDKEMEEREKAAFESLGMDNAAYGEAKKGFGLMTFISKVDIDPALVYLAYARRCRIESGVNRFGKVYGLDPKDKGYLPRIQATNFINTLSAVMLNRVERDIVSKGLDKRYSLYEVLHALEFVCKVRMKNGTWTYGRVSEDIREIARTLGLDMR